MLGISRKMGQAIKIETSDGLITIVFNKVNGMYKLYVDAPRHCRIVREEIYNKENNQ